MKASRKLLDAISFNPSKSTQLISIEDLVTKCLSNDIVLPQYQTGIRWTIYKYVDLLNYQLSGKAPVAAVSMHEIHGEDVEQISFIDRKKIEGNLDRKLSTTDGQQRITCNLKAFINDPSFRQIVLDLKNGKFLINPDEIKKDYQIPVGILMNKDYSVLQEYAASRQPLNDNFQVLVLIRSKLLTYNYVVNIGRGMSKIDQLDWFEKLNNAGSQIPRIQLKLTTLTKSGIDIYGEYTNTFMDILDEYSLSHLLPMKTTEFSIPIALLNPYIEMVTGREHSQNYSPMPSDVKVRELCNLTVEEIRAGFKLTLECLKRAIQFFHEHNLNLRRYDYITYLTGFFVYIQNSELNSQQIDAILKWFDDTDFTNKSNSERREYFTELLNIRFVK